MFLVALALNKFFKPKNEGNNKGYNIDKKQIKTNTSLATLGYHNVDIELHKSVIAKIKVELVK